jgi:hypothetical protein
MESDDIRCTDLLGFRAYRTGSKINENSCCNNLALGYLGDMKTKYTCKCGCENTYKSRAERTPMTDKAQTPCELASTICSSLLWECRCGLFGRSYPRDDTTPANAVKIVLDGCQTCDAYGEDSCRYMDGVGNVIGDE